MKNGKRRERKMIEEINQINQSPSPEDVNKVTHQIIGCSMTIHNTLGNGFQEVIYQRALVIELSLQNLTFEREKEMPIFYRDEQIGTRRVDFFVEDCVMVELKAVEELKNVHKAQAINYLEAYRMKDGLLINFGSTSLQFKRIYNSNLIPADQLRYKHD